jgi:hypothetical protein
LTPTRTVTSTVAAIDTPTPVPADTATSTSAPTPAATETPTSLPLVCVGDCSNDGAVDVSELVTGINIAAGAQTMESCPQFDCNGNGQLTIDCLISAVNASLSGCR